MSLRDLYQEIIIDHGKQPRNFGSLSTATHQQVGHNPLCGDRLVIYLMVADNKLEDIRFEGNGCAISMASASLMIEALKGKDIPIFNKLFDDFHLLVTEGELPNQALGKLSALAGVIEFPMRVKCATLAWHTLKAALQHDLQQVTTE